VKKKKTTYMQLPLISAHSSDSAARPHLMQPKYALQRGQRNPNVLWRAIPSFTEKQSKNRTFQLKTEPVSKQWVFN